MFLYSMTNSFSHLDTYSEITR